MPQLSDSMEEGVIVSWLKQDGDVVARGDELVDIETDKATMTHAADADGVLTILAPEGATLRVGEVIARIGAQVEASPAPVQNLPAPRAEAPPPASANGVGGATAVAATPLARRMARAHGVELAAVAGSGPRGRVTKRDVALKAGLAAPVPAQVAAPPPADGAKGEVTVVELSRGQQTVARRMSEAKATVPEFQVQTEVTMDAVVELRAQIRAHEPEVVPSLNDFVVKAAAVALRSHPRANGSYRDGRFELYGRVNVGVAVAAENTLSVPTVVDADTRSLGSIAAETRRLAERVRAGTITPPELAGATFTVSNLGMFGITAMTPIVNPPQAAILGVGALRPVIDRNLMTLTLTCDHRILYGADAAQFLATIRSLLERPLALAL